MTRRNTFRLSCSNAVLICLMLIMCIFPHTGFADQNNAELEPLFEQLKQAKSDSQAKAIEAQIWQHWLAIEDKNAAALLSQLTYAMSLGQNELALEISNQLIDSNADFAEGWNKRATIHYLLGNHGLSVADIKQTLLLEPRHFGALSGLGLIFMASGNFLAALDAFNAVLKLSPGSANARNSVARAKSMIGEGI